MAGIVYMKSNSKVSLTGPEYTDLSIPSGAKTLYVQTGSATSDRVKYGLTTDTSASEYSPAINVSGRTMYIAKQWTVNNGQSTRTATSIDSYGYSLQATTTRGTFNSYSLYITFYHRTSTRGSLARRLTVATGISHATRFYRIPDSYATVPYYTFSHSIIRCSKISYDGMTYIDTESYVSSFRTNSSYPSYSFSTSIASRAGNNILASSISGCTYNHQTFTYYFEPAFTAARSNYMNMILVHYNQHTDSKLINSTYTYASKFNVNSRVALTSESTYTSSYYNTITTNNIYTGN